MTVPEEKAAPMQEWHIICAAAIMRELFKPKDQWEDGIPSARPEVVRIMARFDPNTYPTGTCKWVSSGKFTDEGVIRTTGCGNTIISLRPELQPTGIVARFCQFCGKPLEVVKGE